MAACGDGGNSTVCANTSRSRHNWPVICAHAVSVPPSSRTLYVSCCQAIVTAALVMEKRHVNKPLWKPKEYYCLLSSSSMNTTPLEGEMLTGSLELRTKVKLSVFSTLSSSLMGIFIQSVVPKEEPDVNTNCALFCS